MCENVVIVAYFKARTVGCLVGVIVLCYVANYPAVICLLSLYKCYRGYRPLLCSANIVHSSPVSFNCKVFLLVLICYMYESVPFINCLCLVIIRLLVNRHKEVPIKLLLKFVSEQPRS
jgi:hypothetical protein